MKIQILSDLHLEFIRNLDELDRFLEVLVPENEDDRDVLVIAGDLGVHAGSKVELGSIVSALTFFAKNYNLVLYVLGNHEFYHSNFRETQHVFRQIEQMIRLNFGETKVMIMDRQSLHYKGKMFFGCTLWFNERPENYLLRDSINDFRFIGNPMEDFHEKGRGDFKALEAALHNDADIIITHHLPSMQSVGKMYKHSRSNVFFVHDGVERLIFSNPSRPRLWIHGHTHDSNDYMLGDDVRVISNPGGYPQRMENPDFIPRLTLEIEDEVS